jgi:lipopolysaccharide/colanic/teichoic acid biosynthesis glycosyltransferase
VANRRNKRLFDVLMSGFSIIFWLPLALMVKQPVRFLKNAVSVLFGRKTWVGYCSPADETQKLPKIRRGVYNPASYMEKDTDPDVLNQLNLLYARDYTVWKDAEIFFRSVAVK